jgi:hypothetical protein
MNSSIAVSVERTFIQASLINGDSVIAQRRCTMPAGFLYGKHETCKALGETLSAETSSTCSPRSSYWPDSDEDDFGEIDCQADVNLPPSKRHVEIDEHVTYIEPDANTVARYWASREERQAAREEREVARARKNVVRAQTEAVQQWQAYQWQVYQWHQVQVAQQHLASTMYGGTCQQQLF